jgi:hypothetical protein
LECLAIRPMLFIGLALVTGLLPSAAGATASPALRECQSNLSTCENNLSSCNSDLSAGRSAPKLPATGQTSSFVPGDDGVIRRCAPELYQQRRRTVMTTTRASCGKRGPMMGPFTTRTISMHMQGTANAPSRGFRARAIRTASGIFATSKPEGFAAWT